jgi:uncharacterized membrane protein
MSDYSTLMIGASGGSAADSSNKKTFFNHVFDTSDESRGLLLNIFQYSFLALIPILLLNKGVQQWIPEIDQSASSLQIALEIFLQLTVMLIGIILVHRLVTFVPTYSGIGYSVGGELNITGGVILIFLIIVLSLQTKMGIKMNMLYERFWHFWNGTSDDDENTEERGASKRNQGKPKRIVRHAASSADNLDSNMPGVFPPMPTMQSGEKVTGGDIRNQMGGGNGIFSSPMSSSGNDIMPANSLLGGSFGGLF